MDAKAITDAFTAHGSLVLSAWAVLFPLGAILIRVVPGSKAWVVHAGVMLFALSVFTSGAAVGMWRTLKDGYKIGSGAHTIMGVTIFSLVWTQPITGLAHHLMHARTDRRTAISALHVFLGRLLTTAALINGGLGLLLNGTSTRAENIAYGTIAGLIWVAYLLISFFYEAKRSNDLKSDLAALRFKRESNGSDAETGQSVNAK